MFTLSDFLVCSFFSICPACICVFDPATLKNAYKAVNLWDTTHYHFSFVRFCCRCSALIASYLAKKEAAAEVVVGTVMATAGV